MLVKQYNQDFVENQCNERTEMSVEDKQFMNIMSESAVLKDGHYYLKLPFRKTEVRMPNNKQVAQQRAQYLLKRFQKDQLFFEEYKEFMHNASMEGHSEIIPQEQLKHEEGKVWYIPHHGVYHPRKKTLRVVYDCASTFAGTSLNKVLLQGPDLTSTLLHVLICFRQGPIALMTDIKGMFHQVRVAEEHVNFLRFLWWPDGDITKQLVEHRMLVHIFGAVSSPSCATYALLKTADDNQHLYPEKVIHTIKHSFYLGTSFLQKELSVYNGILKMTFTFSIVNKDKPLTRHGILSNVSSIYDPLGFLAPVILPAKQILQHLCKLSIRRCVTPKGFGEIKSAQLHHFCDASETGYGAVSYLRLSNSKQEVCVSFIIGKARVAPLKQVTIPRLELAAAVLSVHLDKMLSVELKLNLSESVFWSDSTTVLQYIANITTWFKTYVANRVSIIHALTKVEQWRHISSKLNPADAASRGMTVGCFLKSSTWIRGPEFLSKPVVHWPERQKWNKIRRNFCIGDVVLIVDGTTPRNSWPIGRITETMADAHGGVCHVRVKIRTNELERPINKICLLVEAI
ncbi:4-aminobutyrate aminotransferase / (S)-3-amino-2-methylpropionate transaminase [Sarotherodon galilaeus]